MRKATLALIAALAACGTESPTAPRPTDATVAHFTNREAAAQGLAHIGTELWFVEALHESASDIAGPSTQLLFERSDWSTGALLENVQVQIPDADFTVGGRNQNWSLHTTLAGHGDISLTFRNNGAWQKARFPVDTFPGGTIFRVVGNVVTLSDPQGLAGSIFGQSVGTGVVNLLLADDAVLSRAP